MYRYRMVAKHKTTLPLYKMFLFGVIAGMLIGLGAAIATIQDTIFLKAVVFPVGLILVVITKSELFTGNFLLLYPASRQEVSTKRTFMNLCLVYIGNFTGAILLAIMFRAGNLIPQEAEAVLLAKTSTPFIETLFRAIPCNILVCLAIWLACEQTDTFGKMCMLYIPVFMFVILGFEHCVANMYYCSAGLLLHFSEEGCWQAMVYNIIPSTIGNAIGGILVCSAIQVLYEDRQ